MDLIVTAETMQQGLITNPHVKGVRELSVMVGDGSLILTGRSPDFYRKQMAQHFAMQFGVPIENKIEVDCS